MRTNGLTRKRSVPQDTKAELPHDRTMANNSGTKNNGTTILGRLKHEIPQPQAMMVVSKARRAFQALAISLCVCIILLGVTFLPGVSIRLTMLYYRTIDLWHFGLFSDVIHVEPASCLTVSQCHAQKYVVKRSKRSPASLNWDWGDLTSMDQYRGRFDSHVWMVDNRSIPGPTQMPIGAAKAGSSQNLTHLTDNSLPHPITIALACAITTRSVKLNTYKPLKDSLTFFPRLLDSFCMTASIGYRYVFYMAYDYDDKILSNEKYRAKFLHTFKHMTCSPECANIHVEVKMVRCNHSGKPAYAQNDAMMAAYADNVTYMYMTNDDTVMRSLGWTETLIEALRNMTPPNVGVVGPDHRGGNMNILAYHFIHRTHIDIFRYFYPPNFTDWHSDWWITNVYGPANSKKIRSVRLDHTMDTGTRYIIHMMSQDQRDMIRDTTQVALRDYLAARGYTLISGGMSQVASYHVHYSMFILITLLNYYLVCDT